MKKRPFSIQAIALYYALSSVFTICTSFVEAQSRGLSLFNVLYPYRLMLVVGMALVSIGVWKVRPWGFYGFIVLSVIMLASQFFIYTQHPQTIEYVKLFLLVVTTGIATYFIQKQIAEPYFNPKIRWWEQAPRFTTHIFAELEKNNGQFDSTTIVNISKSGCLLTTAPHQPVGETRLLRFRHSGLQAAVKTKIVRQHDKSNELYGLMFVDLTKKEKSTIKKIVKLASDPASQRTIA